MIKELLESLGYEFEGGFIVKDNQVWGYLEHKERRPKVEVFQEMWKVKEFSLQTIGDSNTFWVYVTIGDTTYGVTNYDKDLD